MKSKNIVIFSEPFVENKDPLMRFNWIYILITKLFNQYVQDCNSFDNETVTFYVVANKFVIKKLKEKNVEAFFIEPNFTEIDNRIGNFSQAIDKVYQNKDPSSVQWLQQQFKSSFEKFAINVDLIISLTESTWFNSIFPNAETIFYEVSPFSRKPFPPLQQWDCYDSYWCNGFVKQKWDLLTKLPKLTNSQERIFNFYKELLVDALKDDFSQHYINKLKKTYSKIILLPLQYVPCIAFDKCTPIHDNIALIEYVMKSIDDNSCVVVTTHNLYKASLSDKDIDYLESKYPNLFYPRELISSNTPSQNLVPCVDAVIAVSTAVLMQSYFFKIPTFVLGDFHFNVINKANTIEDFISKIDCNYSFYSEVDDSIWYWLITKYYFNLLDMEKPQALYNHFINVLKLKEAKTVEDLLSVQEESVEGEVFFNLFKHLSTCINNSYLSNFISYCEEINKNDVISFDVFDTLVERFLANPTDLFLELESVSNFNVEKYGNFSYIRIQAEVLAKKIHGQKATIDDIYNVLADMLSISTDEANILKNFELDLEQQHLHVKKIGQLLFDFSMLLGKKIFCTSDMYLPNDIVDSILKKLNYNNYNLMVSCSFGKTKHFGDLYKLLVKKSGCDKNRILHIGDNPIDDVKVAKDYGLNSLLLPKSNSYFLLSKSTMWLRPLINKNTADFFNSNYLSHSITLGILTDLLVNKVNSCVSSKSLLSNKLSNLGVIYAPFLLGFSQYISLIAFRRNIHTIIFIGRDGFIPYKIFDKVKVSSTKQIYLPISRNIITYLNIRSYDDIFIEAYKNPYASNTIRQFLQDRFLIDTDKISEQYPVLYAEIKKYLYESIKLKRQDLHNNSLDFVLERLKDIILTIALSQQKYLKTLLHQNEFNNEAIEEVLVVDSGCSATIQKTLGTIFPNKNFVGVYVATDGRAASLSYKGYDYYAFFSRDDDRYIGNSNYFIDTAMYEFIMSSTTGTAVSYFMEGNEVKVNYKDNSNFSFPKILEGVNKFVDLYASLTKDLSLEYKMLSCAFITKYTKNIMTLPLIEDIDFIRKNSTYENSYGGMDDNNLISDLVYKNGKVEVKGRYPYFSAFTEEKKFLLSRFDNKVPKINSHITAKNSDNISVGLTRKERLIRKFKANPKLYLTDSSHILLRWIGKLL